MVGMPALSLECDLRGIPTPLPNRLLGRKHSYNAKRRNSFQVESTERCLQPLQRSRTCESRDDLPSASSLNAVEGAWNHVVPIQQGKSDTIFIGGNPGAARPVTRIHGGRAVQVVNLGNLSRAAYDSFVAIHRNQVFVGARDDAQSAHKPKASRSPRLRVGLNRWNTAIAVLPSSHGANSTRAVTSQGSNF